MTEGMQDRRVVNEGRRSLDLPAAVKEMNRNYSKPERERERERERESRLQMWRTCVDEQYAWIAPRHHCRRRRRRRRDRLSRASFEIVSRDKRGLPHQTYANDTGGLNWRRDLENGRIRMRASCREVFHSSQS